MTGRGGQDRTPGQEALREAARLEAARVYGRVSGQPVGGVVDDTAEAVEGRLFALVKADSEWNRDHPRSA